MVDDRPVVDTTTMGMDVYFSLKKVGGLPAHNTDRVVYISWQEPLPHQHFTFVGNLLKKLFENSGKGDILHSKHQLFNQTFVA